MPRPPRIHFPEAYFHIYNRGVNKMPIVQDDRDRLTFMKLLGETVEKFRLRLFAYCLMSNHFHFFLQTLEANLPEAMCHFSLNYCRYYNEQHERVGPLYQGRYQSRLVNHQVYALVLTRYIHQNPLKAGMVKELHEYSWSSYGCYTNHFPLWNGIHTNWILDHFSKDRRIAIEELIRFHRQSPTAGLKRKLSSFRARLF